MADIPASSSTTSTLSVGGSATSIVDFNGDHDWFAVNLTAGQQVTVTIYGITLEDPLLNIRNSSGQVLSTNDDISSGSNRNSKITFTPTSSGIYYIDVGAFNEGYAGTYQVSVQPGTTPPLATVDTIAAYLTNGHWGGDSHHFSVTQGGTLTVNISTLNAAEQNLARTALQEWSDIIGVRFQEVTSGAQITFDNSEDPGGSPVAATDANWSRGVISTAHVHISTSWVNRYGTSLNTYSFQTYLHEIGHALGLGHAGDYNGSATYSTDALFQNDAWSTSIMSYFDDRQNSYFASQGFSRDFAVTPMEADIVAMQTLYGLSTTTRTGDTIYGFNSNAGGIYDASAYPNVALTIFDSGGTDTLDFSGSNAAQLINLNSETFSNVNGQTGNLVIGRGVVIEKAIGGGGGDTLVGNAADNVLTGNLGPDTLTGGDGSDIFKDTRAGHNGDTIKDFSAGDSIVFSDATIGSFTFNLAGHTLSYTGGSLTLTSAPSGTIVASAAAGGGVQLTLTASSAPASSHVHNDFNGDGRSDILWRHDSGQLTDWLASGAGAFAANAAATASMGIDWKVAGTGDFNGDGRADILWRQDGSGQITNWLATASGGFVANSPSTTNVGLDWHIFGVGDFNGDGFSDILWEQNGGKLIDWLGNISGGFTSNAGNFGTVVGTEWRIAGTGDFNGDGRDDILWRQDGSGQLLDWLGTANGGFVTNGNSTVNVGLDWHIAGTGDFNGDGRTDILWSQDGGLTIDWLGTANGTFTSNSANFSTVVGTDWHVAGTGDYNGDHIDDILWRQDGSGQITDWLGAANGGFIPNGANFSDNVASSWHIIDPFL